MGNQYLKKTKIRSNTYNLDFNFKLPTKTIYLESCRLLLGSPETHPEPTLLGHNHCKYGKSILEKSQNSVKYSKLNL